MFFQGLINPTEEINIQEVERLPNNRWYPVQMYIKCIHQCLGALE